MGFQVGRGSRVGRFVVFGVGMVAFSTIVATAEERIARRTGPAAPASAALDADDARLPATALELRQGGRLRVEYLDLQGEGAPVTLDLKRFRVFAPDLRVVVNGEPGELVPRNAYYRGAVVTYDALRSNAAADFATDTQCIESGDGSDRAAMDLDVPTRGAGFHYLVRAQNACGEGSLGSDSDGTSRQAPVCP